MENSAKFRCAKRPPKIWSDPGGESTRRSFTASNWLNGDRLSGRSPKVRIPALRVRPERNQDYCGLSAASVSPPKVRSAGAETASDFRGPDGTKQVAFLETDCGVMIIENAAASISREQPVNFRSA